MKTTLVLSSLLASAFAATIPADAHQQMQRRVADPQPVCDFDSKLSFNDANDNVSPAFKRDLSMTTWSPPSNMVKPLKEVWDHEVATYSDMKFANFGYDQIMATKGKMNYCVRWEGTTKVTAAQRTQVEAAVRKQFNKWIAVLAGFDKFPYKTVDVNVVGWAVKDKSILQGDVSKIDVYTDVDEGGIPQCAEACGRFFKQNNDYSGCKAGAARHYDESLWLTPGFEGGAGGDWGQRIGQEYFMSNLNTEDIHILLHEMGHTFALDDFYDWTPTGMTNFIMLAGSALKITEFDAWMARDWWRNIKSRYGL
ncbi:hypothetical protein P153DRAFT_399710 [Dothidotthia symphoricarpi CBS 119687]|uniref:Cellulose-binding family II protein n=1 Tax=Dothidotthia symphoricarpi CBS 119687 TaxID=1392245 RepID=A0A6A6A3Y1_9PLEO|nr:uncharacterized protein P153DRAFT_399710 [Dothidotthia symphoricarpi CBS 119687]KAF2126256.1 hypothetical protein P153DRAFT_399710 [Dothidotthia symphoricarpi CBS 119687]